MSTSLKPIPDDLPEGRRELAKAVRKALQESNKSLRSIASDAHVSAGYLSLVASGQRKPSDQVLENILRAACSAEERRKYAGRPTRYLTRGWRMLLVAAALALAPWAAAFGLAFWADHCGDGWVKCPVGARPHEDEIIGYIGNEERTEVPLFKSRSDTKPDWWIISAQGEFACQVKGPDGGIRYRVRVFTQTARWTEESPPPTWRQQWWYVDASSVFRNHTRRDLSQLPTCK